MSKKRIFIFPNGFRSLSEGEVAVLSPNNSPSPVEEIDVTDATVAELAKIRRNIADDKNLKRFKRKLSSPDIIKPVTEIDKAGT